MDETDASKNEPVRSDAGHWASYTARLAVSEIPGGAINLNVAGRQVMGPLQGFGQMWQKTYRVRLEGVQVTPVEVMQTWKENFSMFQPRGNNFYPPLTGVTPGQVMFIDSTLPVAPGAPGMIPIAAGVMILYADEESFTVMTPQGFPESGWNTFSAYEEDGCTIAQVQSIARATDPIYEFGLRFMGGARFQERTWTHVLTALAAHYGVVAPVDMHKLCVDARMQWSQAQNVWHNAAIRTVLYRVAKPVRWGRDVFKRNRASTGR